MKYLAMLFLFITTAAFACNTDTINLDGKILVCVTCCVGTNCSTTCT